MVGKHHLHRQLVADRSLVCLYPRPLHLSKRTLPSQAVMSASGQKRKSRDLFDHLVGGSELADGTIRPIDLAVFRLRTKSNLVDCSTGRSAGVAPRNSLSAYSAARLYTVEKLTPYEARPPASAYSRNAKLGQFVFNGELCNLQASTEDRGTFKNKTSLGAGQRGFAKRRFKVIRRMLEKYRLNVKAD